MSITPLFDWNSAAAKRGRTPNIQEKAERTAQAAMTERFSAQVKAMAKADAKRGVYMDKAYINASLAHMREHVSPDRSGPIAQTTALIQRALQEKDPLLELLDRLLEGGSVTAHVSPLAQTAEIRAPSGEIIASYNSLGSGWTEIQTAAEKKFLSESATVYAKAFQEARAEMRAAQAQRPAPDGGLELRA